jgi:hypothetical protein
MLVVVDVVVAIVVGSIIEDVVVAVWVVFVFPLLRPALVRNTVRLDFLRGC